jgi:nicotinic acid mononucleotide adenylyltransferase
VPRLRYLDESDPALRVVGNESTDFDAGLGDRARITVVDFPGIAVSGSTIRERIRHGKTVLYMVPPGVNGIIKAKGYFSAVPTNKND